jgi:hypothetical protein
MNAARGMSQAPPSYNPQAQLAGYTNEEQQALYRLYTQAAARRKP